MSETVGSWTCPHCSRRVPSRIATCRCGFSTELDAGVSGPDLRETDAVAGTHVIVPTVPGSTASPRLVRWLKNVGEAVAVGEHLCELDAGFPIKLRSPAHGILAEKIQFLEGTSVSCGSEIALVAPETLYRAFLSGRESSYREFVRVEADRIELEPYMPKRRFWGRDRGSYRARIYAEAIILMIAYGVFFLGATEWPGVLISGALGVALILFTLHWAHTDGEGKIRRDESKSRGSNAPVAPSGDVHRRVNGGTWEDG